MAELTFELEKGVRIGDAVHKMCTIREVEIGDLKRAARASEVIVLAPTGRFGPAGEIKEPAVLIDPYLMELNTLKQQVVSIGDIKASINEDARHPIDEVYWEKLSEKDMAIIKAHAELIVQAATAPGEVVQRGRTDGRIEGSGDAGQ